MYSVVQGRNGEVMDHVSREGHIAEERQCSGFVDCMCDSGNDAGLMLTALPFLECRDVVDVGWIT